MFRRDGAITFEGEGRSLTFDGDFRRLDATLEMVIEGARSKATYTLSEPEVRELYSFMYQVCRLDQSVPKPADERERMRRFLRDFRCPSARS